MSWSRHYNAITAKPYQTLGLIRRTFSSSIPTKIKKLLYISLVRSIITYNCSPVWKPHLIRDIQLLEQVQRRATISLFFVTTSLTINPGLFLYTLASTDVHNIEFRHLTDILQLVKSLKYPDPSFPVKDLITFSSSNTRSGLTMNHIIIREAR